MLVRLDFVGKGCTSLRVSKGVTDAAATTQHLRYDIVDKLDDATGMSAMMRTTAFPASIIAQMMVRGDVLSRGATPQEKAIDPDKFVAELERRNIKIAVTLSQS